MGKGLKEDEKVEKEVGRSEKTQEDTKIEAGQATHGQKTNSETEAPDQKSKDTSQNSENKSALYAEDIKKLDKTEAHGRTQDQPKGRSDIIENSQRDKYGLQVDAEKPGRVPRENGEYGKGHLSSERERQYDSKSTDSANGGIGNNEDSDNIGVRANRRTRGSNASPSESRDSRIYHGYEAHKGPDHKNYDDNARHKRDGSNTSAYTLPEAPARTRRPADMNSYEQRYSNDRQSMSSVIPSVDSVPELPRIRSRHTNQIPQYDYKDDTRTPLKSDDIYQSSPRPQYTDHESQLNRHREQIRPLKVDRSGLHAGPQQEPGQISSDWNREKCKWEETEEARQKTRLEALERTRANIENMKRDSEKRSEEKRQKREAIMADFSQKMKKLEERIEEGMPSVLTVPSSGYSYFTDEVRASIKK